MLITAKYRQFSVNSSKGRQLGTCDALLTLPQHLQVALDRDMEGRLFQLEFSSAFDRVRQRGLLHKLGFIGVGR